MQRKETITSTTNQREKKKKHTKPLTGNQRKHLMAKIGVSCTEILVDMNQSLS